MKRFWIRRGLRIVSFVLLFTGLAGLTVMSLWNALLPAILGVSTITFWQALGLLVLSRLLFGGFRGPWGRPGFGRPRWKEQMAGRWRGMTPEQREQMRQKWDNHCGRGRWAHRHNPQPESSPQPTPDPTVS